MMKKYICETHKTKMVIDDDGNRQIDINYNALGCYLPGLKTVREQKIGNCVIKEVDSDA
jgi:hypothetical protein